MNDPVHFMRRAFLDQTDSAGVTVQGSRPHRPQAKKTVAAKAVKVLMQGPNLDSYCTEALGSKWNWNYEGSGLSAAAGVSTPFSFMLEWSL